MNMMTSEMRITEERKKDYGFDRLITSCEEAIERFVENVIDSNNKPTTWIHSPISTKDVYLNAYVPAVPVTPNQSTLLLEYLNDKYMRYGYEKFNGYKIRMRKCWFRPDYKLTTYSYDHFFF